MSEIQFVGETLWPGIAGHLFTVFGFTLTILALASYILYETGSKNTSSRSNWLTMARSAAWLHALSIFAIIGLIFFMMLSEMYEYRYVWEHVSSDLPFKYMFSAFWEGQEGSFLLWMFWNAILCIVLIFKARRWEAPVLSVMMLVQMFLFSMILGLHIPGMEDGKIGSSPFILLRESMNAPIFSNPDYLSLIEGNGLNALLQNYWMTIHPPTLFLGFASVVVPFAYAISSLWRRDYRSWLKPAMPWTLFSAFTLGTGILMGSAWAYEALSFGGYWAWDPVENTSLVPWLLLIGGLHTHMVARKTGQSLRTTYFLYIAGFVFVLYSTFLTRSGILEDTSAHAFTEMGLETQLTIFILFFLIGGILLWLGRYNNIPEPEREETLQSKEFWMFTGSLILLFSALLITYSTSLPLVNEIVKFFNPDFEEMVVEDPIPHYNKHQLWIASFIGLLSGFAQFLRYKDSGNRIFPKKLLLHGGASAIISGVLTWLTTIWLNASAWQYLLLLFCTIYTIVANLDYLITWTKTRWNVAGSVMSHVGFGLMILGVMASGLNKQHISTNPFAQRGLMEGMSENELEKNIILMKGVPTFMSGYDVEFLRDSMVNDMRTYFIRFDKKEGDNVGESFTVTPYLQYDKNMQKVAASNPSIQRYWNRDIFTNVRAVPPQQMDAKMATEIEDSLNFKPYAVMPGDSLRLEKGVLVAGRVQAQSQHPEYSPQAGDQVICVPISVYPDEGDQVHKYWPTLVLRGPLIYRYPAQVNPTGWRVTLPDKIMDQLVQSVSQSEMDTLRISPGDEVRYKDYRIRLNRFVRDPSVPDYATKKGDLILGADLTIRKAGRVDSQSAQPVMIIRNNQLIGLKHRVSGYDLTTQFNYFHPKTETMVLTVSEGQETGLNVDSIPLSIAQKVPRDDYIVLEAIVFPGINLLWGGAICMLLGLLVSMWRRYMI